MLILQVMTHPKSYRDIVEVLTDLDFVEQINENGERDDNKTQPKQSTNGCNKTVKWELVGTAHSSTE